MYQRVIICHRHSRQGSLFLKSTLNNMQWNNNDNFQIENKLMWQVPNSFKTNTFETVVSSLSNIRNQVVARRVVSMPYNNQWGVLEKRRWSQGNVFELWLHPFFFSPQKASLISMYQSIFKILPGGKKRNSPDCWFWSHLGLWVSHGEWKIWAPRSMNVDGPRGAMISRDISLLLCWQQTLEAEEELWRYKEKEGGKGILHMMVSNCYWDHTNQNYGAWYSAHPLTA